MSLIARLHNAASILLGLVGLCHSIFIPPYLTGPLPVGVVSYELNNTSLEPSRDLMVSIYYPALASECKNYSLAPDFSPQFDVWDDTWLTVPDGASESMIQLAYDSPPISHSHYPVLFFSPGYGNSRLFYNGAVQDLASNGYIVVSMDHPNDTDYIVYPDGRTALFFEDDDQPIDAFTPVLLRRASDVIFILNHLQENAHKAIPGLHSPLNLTSVGILGHSMGGATASQAMLNDTRFIAGINLDGSVPNPTQSAGLDAPFLMMASAGHQFPNTSDPDSMSDPTWLNFYNNLRGWRRLLRVNQTMHHHYSDTVYLQEELKPDGYPANEGFLNGTYMYELESAYVLDFFDIWFKRGKGELLKAPTARFPEVIFDG